MNFGFLILRFVVSLIAPRAPHCPAPSAATETPPHVLRKLRRETDSGLSPDRPSGFLIGPLLSSAEVESEEVLNADRRAVEIDLELVTIETVVLVVT